MKPATNKLKVALIGALALAATALSASAVDVTVWVKAYGTTWARVVKDSNTGGKIKYDSISAYTDRIARGEEVNVDLWASSAERYSYFSFVVRSDAGVHYDRVPFFGQISGWYNIQKFHMMTSPAADNVRLRIITCADDDRVDLPVGSR